MKKLKRTTIIRDSDLHQLIGRAFGRQKLYDHLEIEHLTYRGLQHENLILTLKDPDSKDIPRYRTLPDAYEELLYREKLLYDRRYLNWSLTVDYPDGMIYVQSRIDCPKEPLYRVTLERDY